MATRETKHDVDKYMGTWKISECVSLAGTVDTAGIEGSEFRLTDSGDVTWKVTEDIEAMPFFNSDTYEILFPPGKHNIVLLKFFGTLAEDVIEFNVEIADEFMLLTCERCCMLQCQKILSEDPKGDCPYSFGKALDEGYFSDMVIKSDSGKEFAVHSLILGMSAPEMDWWRTPPPLTGLREDILKTVLHFLYTETLPRGLSEETAKLCIKTVGKLPGMEDFSQMCDSFLKNTALREQIESLIGDMHTSADRIIDMFKCKKSPISAGLPPEDALASNPPRLCYIIKQAAREAAIAFLHELLISIAQMTYSSSKFVLLCDLFARRSGELPQEERHAIIKYARSRLPVFVKQLKEFFDIFKFQMSFVGVDQKREIATYVLPEVETLCSMLTKFTEEFRTALDKAIKKNIAEKEKSDKGEKHKKEHVKDVLGKTLRHALHVRELKKLKHMHDTASTKFAVGLEKLEHFNRKPNGEKIQKVSVCIDEIKDREAPMLVERVERLAHVLEDKFKWREWKYLFKLGTSKVAWAINKLYNYKESLESSLLQIVETVNKDEFTASMTALGLYSPESQKSEGDDGASSASASKPVRTKYAQLSSVESLCVSPVARNSKLAKRSLELLRQGQKTDMMFEIRIIHDVGDTVIDHTQGEPVAKAESDRDVDIYEIPAHRVILASRCNWFCRALLSGMRESIDKKINIHDTNPEVFTMFLEYMYGGQLKADSLTTEQLSELLTLGDRYEVDSLKSYCELLLQKHVDNDTALYLFSLADQFQTKILKERTLAYLVENPQLTEGEVFQELPDHLKNEVEVAIVNDKLDVKGKKGPKQSSGLENIPSIGGVVNTMNDLYLDSGDDQSVTSTSSGDNSSVDSVGEYPVLMYPNNPERLSTCITALREIVGEEPAQEDLVRVILLADFDVNRAINFFYSS